MAYNETLASRIRGLMEVKSEKTEEKKMMGGLTFMLRGKMCCGVVKDVLMARVGPEKYEKALEKPHCRQMDFTGKPFVGYVYVDEPGLTADSDLETWLDWVIAYNHILIETENNKPAKRKTQKR